MVSKFSKLSSNQTGYDSENLYRSIRFGKQVTLLIVSAAAGCACRVDHPWSAINSTTPEWKQQLTKKTKFVLLKKYWSNIFITMDDHLPWLVCRFGCECRRAPFNDTPALVHLHCCDIKNDSLHFWNNVCRPPEVTTRNSTTYMTPLRAVKEITRSYSMLLYGSTC